MDWFSLAVISALMFGIQGFLFKKSSEKGCNKFIVTLALMTTVEILSLSVFLIRGADISHWLPVLVLGLLYAGFFYVKTIWDLKALEYLPTSKVFPITSSNAVLVVIYAVIFFNEHLKPTEILGILAIITTIMFIHSDSRSQVDYSKARVGLFIATIAIIPGAGIKIVNKYAAVSSDTIAFTAVSFFFLVLVSLSGYNVSSKNESDRNSIVESVKLGILIGIVNFAGFYSHLFALKTGPLSIISTIHASYVVISVILARLFLKEPLTRKQFALVGLSVAGIILLKIDPAELARAAGILF